MPTTLGHIPTIRGATDMRAACQRETSEEKHHQRANILSPHKAPRKAQPRAMQHTHTHAHTFTRTHTHAHTYSHTHIRTTHTHARTHTHTHTLTHTPTLTHTRFVTRVIRSQRSARAYVSGCACLCVFVCVCGCGCASARADTHTPTPISRTACTHREHTAHTTCNLHVRMVHARSGGACGCEAAPARRCWSTPATLGHIPTIRGAADVRAALQRKRAKTKPSEGQYTVTAQSAAERDAVSKRTPSAKCANRNR
jgi:hypothetical protein